MLFMRWFVLPFIVTLLLLVVVVVVAWPAEGQFGYHCVDPQSGSVVEGWHC